MGKGPLLLTLALLSSACTEALLQPQAVTESTLDDRLQIRGRVCTNPPDPSGFPVKIVFLIDSSGSMCISDGPGSQASNGFCETVGDQLAAMGITTPGRVRALHSLIDRFRNQRNVQVALIPFDSKVSNMYPATGFTPASDGALPTRIDALQNELGKGTDYQGALAEAYARIDADIQGLVTAGRRGELPRTKYVVILLTDGIPYPRCTTNDADPDPSVYATPARPWGIWRDNPVTFCNPLLDENGDILENPNLDENDQEIVLGFTAGADRNQNYQVFDAADRLSALKDKYNIGEVRLHTIMLLNKEAVNLCGEICMRDVYSIPGGTAEDAARVAEWTLRQIAIKHGNGTFQQFTDMAQIELGSLDYSSLASRFVQKTLLVSNTAAFPVLQGPSLDSDGDAVPDTEDSERVVGTNHLNVDTDGDGFPDSFELAHRPRGFDPLLPDPRGCKDGPGFIAVFSCRDTDGDGLSQAAEVYLGTDPTLPDSDADGIPDGAEVLLRMDPAAANERLMDHDLDGVPDLLEVFQHSNPMLDDRLVHARDSYRYEIVEVPQDNGRVCYDYLVTNIRLMTPDQASGQHGYNFITLTFGEAPETGVSRDYGLWKKACAFAQFAPPSLRSPAGPELTLTERDFARLDDISYIPGSSVPTNFRTFCKGAVP
ncbi:MAG: VWA domain-containing protein [Deltaproteobacteria bacterium]|nr:VWA domain-containing protein [Deltaproteobacteria bacterium]